MIVYLDTSAIVKAVGDEAGTEEARRLWFHADARFSSRIAYAEARAALARASRVASGEPKSRGIARQQLEVRWNDVQPVEITDDLVRLAGDLADRRGLRGYDSVHLASALILGEGVLMASWDRELNEAASAEGLHVLTH